MLNVYRALLVQTVMSTACRPLFIAGENAVLMVVTVLKKTFCSREFSWSDIVTVLLVSVVVPLGISRKCFFWSDLHTAILELCGFYLVLQPSACFCHQCKVLNSKLPWLRGTESVGTLVKGWAVGLLHLNQNLRLTGNYIFKIFLEEWNPWFNFWNAKV